MNPCDLIPDDAILWVTVGDDAPNVTTWEAFQGDNCAGQDGDALAFLEDVATALHARREYRGGGGAAPAFVVRWYPVPSCGCGHAHPAGSACLHDTVYLDDGGRTVDTYRCTCKGAM